MRIGSACALAIQRHARVGIMHIGTARCGLCACLCVVVVTGAKTRTQGVVRELGELGEIDTRDLSSVVVLFVAHRASGLVGCWLCVDVCITIYT